MTMFKVRNSVYTCRMFYNFLPPQSYKFFKKILNLILLRFKFILIKKVKTVHLRHAIMNFKKSIYYVSKILISLRLHFVNNYKICIYTLKKI